jgi:GTPase SAR1 family protein
MPLSSKKQKNPSSLKKLIIPSSFQKHHPSLIMPSSPEKRLQGTAPSSLDGNEHIRLFMDKLTATTNVAQYVNLPMIAVMGDTSSGKSSLLSSISGVELPSASELTTRCPIMLQMKKADKCSAQVSVNLKNPKKNEIKAFETRFIAEDKWATITEAIRAAQDYIIQSTGKQVANDIVSVQVNGPFCEDLTLVDLPGIVRARGVNESQTISNDIQSLINEYLQNKRCIILAVVPANVDFHNSQILADASRVDPGTTRTLPVITKPDLIDQGGEKDVRDLLLGLKTEKFEKGFHMVMGRGQAALNNKQSIQAGLEKEEHYFDRTSPWNDISDRSLFGTKQLRIKLGDLYLDIIRASLPDIIQEMQDKKENATDTLSEIGTVHTTTVEKRLFVTEVVGEIKRHVSSHICGSPTTVEHTGVAKFYDACDTFKNKINQGQLADTSAIKIGMDVLVQDTQEIVGGKVGWIKGNNFYIVYNGFLEYDRPTFVGSQIQGLSRPEEKGWVGLSKKKAVIVSLGGGCYKTLNPIPAELVRRNPQWIQSMITKRRTYELPIFVDPVIFRGLVMQFIEDDWITPCCDIIEAVKSLFDEAMVYFMKEATILDKYPKFKECIRKFFDMVSRELLKDLEKDIDKYIKKEQETPYTQDASLFDMLQQKRVDWFLQEIRVALSLDQPNLQNQNITKATVKTVVDTFAAKIMDKSVDEYMAEEMVNALDAYGKVASKRCIDHVPILCLDHTKKFSTTIENHLLALSDIALDRLIVDSVGSQAKREQLQKEVQELEAGLAVLASLLTI